MTSHPQHLEEERLFDSYLAERGGESLDPRVAEHLADCVSCLDRFEDLSRFMDGLKEEAVEETDAVFTPERLRVQHSQIARRLSQAGRVARIISFPGRLVGRRMGSTASHAGPRWMAAAAAAGLFVGVGLGMSVHPEQELDMGRAARANRPPAPLAAPPVASPHPAMADYGAFLLELDQAQGGPRAPELRPFDAMTPHVQGISVRLQ